MTSAKASRRVDGTEATHWPISALDPSMILFNAVVEILAVPVADIGTKLASNRTRVTVMPIGGYPGRSDASALTHSIDLQHAVAMQFCEHGTDSMRVVERGRQEAA